MHEVPADTWRRAFGNDTPIKSSGFCTSLFAAGFRCHSLTCDVEEDSADDNKTKDHVLDCGVNRQKGEAVPQGRDDQSTDDGTEHSTFAAHEGCAADNAGCDGVSVVGLDRVRAVADAGTADGDDTCDRCRSLP